MHAATLEATGQDVTMGGGTVGGPHAPVRRRRARVVAVGALLAVAAVACGDAEAPAPPLDQAAQDQRGEGDAVNDTTLRTEVSFAQQGGGVRGGGQQLEVAPDGQAMLTTGSPDILEPVGFEVPEADLAELASAVAAADLAGQPEFDPPDDRMIDALLLVFTDGDESRTVVFDDAPEALRTLAEVFQDIIATAPDHPRT